MSAVTDDERLIVLVEARIRDLERNMARASATTGREFGQMRRHSRMATTAMEADMIRSTTRINMALASVSTRIGAVSTAASARFAAMGRSATALSGALGMGGLATIAGGAALTKFAGDYRDIQNALKVAGLEGEKLTEVYDRLRDSAQKNAAPLSALVELYGRASQVQNELGVSSEELLSFTDHVALALRVSGKSASEASGALLQLSQALGSGTVHAEEFNSILENALPVAQAAAAGLEEAGGSVAKLRALINDGKVSSQAFFRAFEAGSGILEEKVAGAEKTVSQGFIRLQNVLIDTTGKLDDTVGISDDVVGALNSIASAVENAGSFFDRFGGDIKGAIDWLDQLETKAYDAAEALGIAAGRAIKGASPDGMVKDAFNRTEGSGSGDAANDAAISDWLNGRGKGGGLVIDITEGTRPKPVSLDDYPVTGGSAKGGKKGRAKVDSYQREIDQIKERTAAIQAETAAQAGLDPLIDDYGYAVEKARAKQELLNAAQEAGIAITPEVTANIEKLADAYASASASADKLAESQDRARQSAKEMAGVGQEAVKGFISDLRGGASAGDALSNALNRIADKLIDMAVNKLMENALGGLGGAGAADPWAGLRGTGGGGLGGLGGLIGGVLSLLGLAEGGQVDGPGTATSDSIPAMLSDGEFVVNAKAAKKHGSLLEAINGGGLEHFAAGGAVGGARSYAPVSPRAPAASHAPQINFKQEVVNSYGPDVSVRNEEQDDGQGGKVMRTFVEKIVDDRTLKGGTPLQRSLKRSGIRGPLRTG
ncbi:tape measure protein [Consotaella salsifontis]|uniref:Tape measure domain-containing protein n=1 Tax=Consotaella salsifontis TaxID=1365950 RepID=A0A1T4SDD0_9HYPH|nr:tape measure protein [Consotaella salsifontis]SKA26310.1 tape measure domain-containing protein [Consotaella salsifontis]